MGSGQCGLCYNPILGFIKASIILIYLRLGVTKQGMRVACYGLLFLTLGLTLALDLADAFECALFEYTWNSRAMDLAAQKAQGANETVTVPGYGPILESKDRKYFAGRKCFDRPKFVLAVAAGDVVVVELFGVEQLVRDY